MRYETARAAYDSARATFLAAPSPATRRAMQRARLVLLKAVPAARKLS